jgi:hypothetical protein
LLGHDRGVWLTSYDPEHVWLPVEVVLESRVQIGDRRDLAWARLSRSIPLSGQTHYDRVLIGARHVGGSVWETPDRWPVHVYLCTTESEHEGDLVLARDQVTIERWGLLHQTRERAETDEF